MAKKPTLEEFFSDPKHTEDADFMRGAVKKVLGEVMEEERKKKVRPKKEKTFLQKLFDSDDGEEESEEK